MSSAHTCKSSLFFCLAYLYCIGHALRNKSTKLYFSLLWGWCHQGYIFCAFCMYLVFEKVFGFRIKNLKVHQWYLRPNYVPYITFYSIFMFPGEKCILKIQMMCIDVKCHQPGKVPSMENIFL